MKSEDEDFIVRLLKIIADNVGGMEEQLAQQIALQISREWGGDRPYINRPSKVIKWFRDQEIARYVRSGHSVKQAADKFGMTRQGVYQIPRMRRRR